MLEKYTIDRLKEFRVEISKFVMPYKFAIDEVSTKINILREEFTHLHDYNPIEHVSSRLKSVESIVKKVQRKNIDLSIEAIRQEMKDIAGVRITCSFRSDIYKIKEMIESQRDVKVLEVKDYFKEPKPNGYRSLHMIIEIPVFLSDRVENTPVEIQIRTIAMDFWASLEHKIFYKYNKDVPQRILDDLRLTATIATELDKKMEQLNEEINDYKQEHDPITDAMNDQSFEIDLENNKLLLPNSLTDMIKERSEQTPSPES